MKKRGYKMHTPSAPNVPPSPCPYCGMTADCASAIGDEGLPEAGTSCGICIRCGAVNGYDESLRLVPLNAMELLRFELDERAGPVLRAALRAALRAWRATVAQRGRPGQPLAGGIMP